MKKEHEEATIIHPIAEVSLRDKALAELGKVDKGIADLKAKFAGKVYDCTTTAGMSLAKEARLEIRDVRYQVPKIAEKVTKQLNALKAEVKDEAERIVSELLEIENVSHLQIQAEEDRKAEIKRQKEEAELLRVQTIKERIAVITGLHLKLVNVPNSLSMREIIQTVKEQVTATEAEFQEWQPMAQMAIDETLRQMEIIASEKESAEIEECRKAQEYADQQRKMAEEQEALRLAKEAFEREQEAVRAEAKRVEAEWQAEQDAKAAAQKIENDRIAAEQKALQDKIDAERAELEEHRKQEEADRYIKEENRLTLERQEQERLQAEAAARIEEQRKIDEARRMELEAKQHAEFVEKMKAPYNALRKIKDLCENKELTALAARNQINAVADIALEGKE